MGTHDPSICVSTTLSAFVVAKDEGDMVENVCCPVLIELVLESNTICASCSALMVAPTKGTPTVPIMYPMPYVHMWSMMNSQRDSRHYVALRSLWHNSPQGSGWYRMVCYSLKWSSTMWLACCQWPTAACSAHECVPSGRGALSSPLCHPSCRSLCREEHWTHSLQMRSEVEETSITLCFSPESTYTSLLTRYGDALICSPNTT